jgi:undecaprenyl pyrophosphate phosphatase UppP
VSCAADAVLHVSTFQAAVLGLTQGLSEFIPISSSGT